MFVCFNLSALERRLKRIMDEALAPILKEIKKMATGFEDLGAALAENTTVTGSIELLIQRLAGQIANLPANEAALKQFAADLRGNSARLVAQAVANTEAAPDA